MAKERLYGWNGEMPEKPVSGQALIVLNGLRAEPETLKTGHGWADTIGKELRTRQDPYRVVLYYILILKNKGCVRTNEFDINAVTKTETVKHAITVKTAASIEERYSVAPEPSEPADPIDEQLDAVAALLAE